MTDNPKPKPQSTFNVLEAGAVIVGVVIGVGIFKTPALVAANVSSESSFLMLISKVGVSVRSLILKQWQQI